MVRLTSIRNHPFILGLLAAIIFTLLTSSYYLVIDGLKLSFNGLVNADLFAGLPLLIETKRLLVTQHILLSSWFTPFSYPFPVGDASFYELLHSFLYLLINNVTFTYKLYVILLLGTSFFTMYILSYSLASRHRVLSAILSATFFALTPYFLLELTGHLYMMWSYALLPITYYFIYRALNETGKRKYSLAIIAGIFIALSAFYPSMEYIYINGLFLFIFSLIVGFKVHGSAKIKALFQNVLRIVIMFSIAFLLSVFFIVPAFAIISPYSQSLAFSRTNAYPVYSNTYIESSFLLNKGLSSDLGLNYFNIFGTLMLAFLLPIILSSVLIIAKRKYVYLTFFVLGLLGVFFAMGSNAPPLLRFFEYARNLPLLSADRTPSRFTSQIALAFSLLGGIAFGVIFDKIGNLYPSLSKVLKIGYNPKVIGFLLFLVIIIPYLFSGISVAYSIAGPFQMQSMSNNTSDVVAWLNSHDPNQDYRLIDLTQAGLVSAYFRSLQIDGGDLVARFYRSPSFATLLGMYNVKYIVTDPDSSGRAYYSWQSDINQVLSQNSDFDKVQIGNETIYVNQLAKPEIYPSYGALAVGGVSGLSTFYSAIDGVQIANGNSQSSLNDNWAMFDMSDNNFGVFGTGVSDSGVNLNRISDFNAVVFQDSDLIDLAFQELSSNYKMQAWKYMNENWRIVEDQYGNIIPSVESYQSSVDGQLVLSERALYTDTYATLTIPFKTNSTGIYDVWVRAANTVPMGSYQWGAPLPSTQNSISASIDGSTFGKANFGQVGGFKWLKISNLPLSLSQGSHTLNLLTSGDPIYLDMVAVVPSGLVSSAMNQVTSDIAGLQQMYILEFSNYFAGENAYRDATVVPYSSDTWSGYLTLEQHSTIEQNLYVAKSDFYVLDLRLLLKIDSGNLNLKIDGSTVLNVSESGINTWTWVKSGSIYLSAGEHEIVVTNDNGYSSIDLMSLVEQSLIQHISEKPGQVQYNQVQLNNWQGTMAFNKPAFVIFTESYYPEWAFSEKIGANSTSVQSLEAFYFLNAYYINFVGVSDFSLAYQLSSIRFISIVISILTFVGCIVIIVVERFRTKKPV